MKKQSTVFLSALILSLFAVSIISHQSPGDASGQDNVIDCRNQSVVCGQAPAEKNLVDCGYTWRQGQNYSKLDCNYSSEGAGQVSLISDAANYVDIERTDMEYNVTSYSEVGSQPWDLEFLPDGSPVWTTKRGDLYRMSDGQAERLESMDVEWHGENGLLGMAVDPDFEENNYIYLYYTYNISDRETLLEDEYIHEQRISRFELVNGSLRNEKELLQAPGSKYHSGGRLEFGPDGKLYITTGEAYMEYDTVDPEFLGGKVLRINSDGSIPEDNPFDGNPTYSMGHRNPQGIAWNPETGQLYNSEHGPWRHDELNRVEPGENYGWPYYKCGERFKKSISYWNGTPVPDAYNRSKAPAHCWEDYTMAPSGMTFVNDTESPWHGDLFVAGLRGDHLARFTFEDESIQRHEAFYISKDEQGIGLRLRDVEYSNGSLYIVGDQRGMVRIDPLK